MQNLQKAMHALQVPSSSFQFLLIFHKEYAQCMCVQKDKALTTLGS